MQKPQPAEEQGLLGSLCPGQKKLEGKTFYLDSVKKRATALLLEAISLLGGRVEGFLHKDVNFVVTGSQEGLSEQKSADTNNKAKEASEKTRSPVITREHASRSDKQQPGTPRPMVCGSRGKALLEKAIRNNERLKGSSVLANARSWGVKILHADDVLLYLKQLTRESFRAEQKRPERARSKQSAHVVKAAALRSPYLKIEDLSRKYRPLHMQSMTFPSMCYSGRFSPFESPPPPPPLFDKQSGQKETKTRVKKVESSAQDKSQTALSCTPSPWRPRKKDLSYCECCHQPFNNMEEHLQSDQHRAFVLDPSNYSVLDQLVAEMLPGFDPDPLEQSGITMTQPAPCFLPVEDVRELEPLTDVETEQAVQALQSFDAHTFDAQPLTPAQLQPVPPHTDCRRPPSPVMPVLDVELQTNQSTSQPLDPCPSTDPYSLPPILSPQVSSTPHSPYSEPPVLSPQRDAAEEAACETHSLENVASTRTGDLKRANKDFLLGLSEIICSNMEWESAACSLPCPSAAAPNPKKRCRSASPEPRRRKRRRTAEADRSEETETSKPEGSCPLSQSAMNQKLFSACTQGSLTLKQTFTMFSVPAVQDFTLIPNHTNTLTQGVTASCSLSEFKTFNPLLPLPHDKSLSSQDSQRSLSLSTSVCIEPALIPDVAAVCPSSSDSDWDCDLLSRLVRTSNDPPSLAEQDKELLHRPCTWMHDTSYESRLHNVLEAPSAAAAALQCGEEMDSSAFSRTVVQIVEVQH
ncbi:uncharacterized protein dbf4b [Halichoeres trimaculatus]|uniref:uncharacterized protein dbf4b n=1 Tax=Halichoeres trimaculatus TaxID=147232 RepID=UPI003D9DDA95